MYLLNVAIFLKVINYGLAKYVFNPMV